MHALNSGKIRYFRILLSTYVRTMTLACPLAAYAALIEHGYESIMRLHVYHCEFSYHVQR